jgi:hypothetical protein
MGMLGKADDLLMAGSKGNVAVSSDKNTTYIRSSCNLVQSNARFAIDTAAINKYNNFSDRFVQKSKITFADLSLILNIHIVRMNPCGDGVSCTCKMYQVFLICSHSAAKRHLLGSIDVFSLIAVWVPKRSKNPIRIFACFKLLLAATMIYFNMF